MPFDNLLLQRESGVAVLTIHHIRQAALDFQQDQSIRRVIITGSGSRAFVAEADINEIARR